MIRGDCHGDFTWLTREFKDKNIIILGDAGINFYLNKTDKRLKQRIMESGATLYCVRGNHEARPQTLPNIQLVYDELVKGEVYVEPTYPNIKYFKDYGIYNINNYPVIVIGGAYSVDKWHRILRSGLTEETNDPRRTGWFADEQLNEEEMAAADKLFAKHPDLYIVLSHTCPFSWQPVDLFLPTIDQFSVDNNMELWLDKVKDNVNYFAWVFGHYHCDRKERNNVLQMYKEIRNFEDVVHELGGL